MNKIIVDNNNYAFNASTGKITFTEEYGAVPLEHLMVITNVTTNTIIYNFGCDGFGGSMNGLTLTLESSTSGMSNDDDLQIIQYVENSPSETEIINSLNSQEEQLDCLQAILEQTKLTNKWLKEILR